jgi:Ferredoxin-like domain in Api92-like protein
MANHVTTRCTVIGPAMDVAAFREQMIIKDEGSGDFWLDNISASALATLAAFREVMRVKQTEPRRLFDFEKIIPVPAILRQVRESDTSEHGAGLIILRGELGASSRTVGMTDTSIQYFRDDVGMPDEPIHEVAAAFLQVHPDYEAAGRLRLQALLETGFTGWYSFNTINWGTKDNSYSFRAVSEDPLEFLFDTAWDFPLPIFEALAREFPSLQFKCLTFDEGWRFGGEGCFNPAPGNQPFQFRDATDELYERVYGEKYVPPAPSRGRRKMAAAAS